MDYKDIIFSRYTGEFIQADETDATDRKSSEDIVFDLSSMATFSVDEISVRMTLFEYKIGFDDSKPVWLMKRNKNKQINE